MSSSFGNFMKQRDSGKIDHMVNVFCETLAASGTDYDDFWTKQGLPLLLEGGYTNKEELVEQWFIALADMNGVLLTEMGAFLVEGPQSSNWGNAWSNLKNAAGDAWKGVKSAVGHVTGGMAGGSARNDAPEKILPDDTVDAYKKIADTVKNKLQSTLAQFSNYYKSKRDVKGFDFIRGFGPQLDKAIEQAKNNIKWNGKQSSASDMFGRPVNSRMNPPTAAPAATPPSGTPAAPAATTAGATQPAPVVPQPAKVTSSDWKKSVGKRVPAPGIRMGHNIGS